MNGPKGLRGHLGAHLAAVCPDLLEAAAIAAAIDPGKLPMPAIRGPLETRLLSADEIPCYMVVVGDTNDVTRVDTDEWVVTYRTRVYAIARGESYDAAGDNRDLYTQVLRLALAGVTVVDGAAVKVPLDSWRESFSEVNRAAHAGSVAASYCEFLARVTEHREP